MNKEELMATETAGMDMEREIREANNYYRKGRYWKALSLYNRIADRRPDLARKASISFNQKLIQKKLPILKNQIIVYSVLTGDYEDLKEPKEFDPTVRYVLFTDNGNLKSETWEIIPFETLGLDPRRASRLPKLLPHLYLPDHEISIYIDASLTLTEANVEAMANNALHNTDIAGYPHYRRNCTFDEIEECLKLGKVDKQRAELWRSRLEKEQFPRRWGLLENAMLIRRNSPVIRRINELWFKEYINGPERDQFSLMYVLWRSEIPFAKIADSRNFRESPHVIWTAHIDRSQYSINPDLILLGKHFRLLKETEPSFLVKVVEEVVRKLVKSTTPDNYPAVSTKLMRQAIAAINWLELQSRDEAQKCRNALTKALFPVAASFNPNLSIKLAYIPNSAMPTQAANNVHVMKMCAAFAKTGTDVMLYTERDSQYKDTAGKNLSERFGTDKVFPVLLVKKDKRGRENLLYRLVRQAITDGCTHIYTRSLEVAVYASIADIPFIFEEHKAKGESEYPYLDFIARSPALEKLVVISTPLKKVHEPILQTLRSKIEVLHDAADPVNNVPALFDLGLAQKKGANVGYVGHLYPGKGAELCWDLARRMPHVSFHMLGGTEIDIGFWKERSRELTNITFHGHRPHAEVPGFIESIDICIAPFLRTIEICDGKYNVADFFSPLKIFEYMAHGKPIVTSDLPVLREVLTNEQTAIMCDPDRPETFVLALERLIADPQLGLKIGNKAQSHFEKNFTWSRRAQAIRNLFKAGQPKLDMIPPTKKGTAKWNNQKVKPVVRWYYGGEKQAGWAYGVNARRLSSRIPSCNHIAPGSTITSAPQIDVALAFDILIMIGEKFKNGGAKNKILRVGGPNPLKIFSGGNISLLKETLAQADSIIALSPQLCDYLRTLHHSVYFIPNGIDTAVFSPQLRNREPSTPFTVGMSASISKEVQRHVKGYYFATDACKEAGVDLLMIGRGINQIPHDLLVEQFWSKIDILLHPVGAGKEASSNVIMEALALGVPVITTRHAGFHGIALEHGREGLIMRRTVADFAEAIRTLRTDPGLCNILATGGRAFVERHHALDIVARVYEDVIWNCLKRGKEKIGATTNGL
jgi:glycosyltransferase involved in cell wall biosynthesis